MGRSLRASNALAAVAPSGEGLTHLLVLSNVIFQSGLFACSMELPPPCWPAVLAGMWIMACGGGMPHSDAVWAGGARQATSIWRTHLALEGLQGHAIRRPALSRRAWHAGAGHLLRLLEGQAEILVGGEPRAQPGSRVPCLLPGQQPGAQGAQHGAGGASGGPGLGRDNRWDLLTQPSRPCCAARTNTAFWAWVRGACVATPAAQRVPAWIPRGSRATPVSCAFRSIRLAGHRRCRVRGRTPAAAWPSTTAECESGAADGCCQGWQRADEWIGGPRGCRQPADRGRQRARSRARSRIAVMRGGGGGGPRAPRATPHTAALCRVAGSWCWR